MQSFRFDQSFLQDESSQSTTKIATTWISTQIDIFGRYSVMFVNVVCDEFVDSKAVINRLWKWMSRCKSIVNRKNRYFGNIGPFSSIYLCAIARHCHITTAMHVNHYILNICLTRFLTSFGDGLVVKYSHRYGVLSWLKYVYVVIWIGLEWNIDDGVGGNGWTHVFVDYFEYSVVD